MHACIHRKKKINLFSDYLHGANNPGGGSYSIIHSYALMILLSEYPLFYVAAHVWAMITSTCMHVGALGS